MSASRRKIWIGGAAMAAAVALAIVVIGVLGDDASSEVSEIGPVVLSEDELREQAGDLAWPIYWIGPRSDARAYELTFNDAESRAYVRYLAKPGADQETLLAVGTYPTPNALRDLQQRAGSELKLSEHDGYVVLDAGSFSENAYVVFDQQPGLQVEVFSLKFGEAAKLANSGGVVRLG